ncbi:MAG: TlpA family protein disulfide reductase [Myxococcaceae bacterium]|nr:TlpA family protein disulfide reductase [Myxococcaceae bacterium]
MTLFPGMQARPLRPAARWLNGPPTPEELRDRALVIHFWSLSCQPCLEQLPRVKAWAKRNPELLKVISVHTPLELGDMEPERVVEEVRRVGIEHPLALDGDDGALADIYQVGRTPACFLFDGEKKLRAVQTGPGAAERLEPEIAELLEELERSAERPAPSHH